MSTPSFHSDPHVQYLTQIMDEIRDGLIQIPRFQRPMVWDWERRLELLRSIRDGIPMGAIMVWRSPKTEIECYHHLGPHRLEIPTSTGSRQYLLDGVQRLSTLYGALHKPNSESPLDHVGIFDDDLPTENFEVLYDLNICDFVQADAVNSAGTYMPLHMIFDSVGMLRFQRSLDENDFEEMVRASEAIAKAFREYKVPIIPIVTDDVEMATRTFQRINSQGKAMSEAHMIHALSWDGEFDLNRTIEQIKSEILILYGWQDIKSDIILKASKAALGFDVYRSNADEIGAAFRENPEVFDQVAESCILTSEFLLNHCGVPRPDLVPYSLQLVSLIDIFRTGFNQTNENLDILKNWFWTTTYGEVYAGMSGDQFDTALKNLRNSVSTGRFNWAWKKPFEVRSLPSKFDFRTVRAKAFAFRLADKRNEVLGDDTGTELLDVYGRDCIMQVLPRISENRGIYSSYANRFLIDPNDFQSFRQRLLSNTLTSDELEMHLLNDMTSASLSIEDHDNFINNRLASIEELEGEFSCSQYEPLIGARIL